MYFSKLGMLGGGAKRFLLVHTISRDMSSSLHSNGNIRMGFVGTGKIAQAIILGIIKNQKLKPEQIYVSDANQQYVTMLKEKHPFFQVFYVFFIIKMSNLYFIQIKTFC
jgi:NADH/NAD ratio-sensing transcriptional regulator Rex